MHIAPTLARLFRLGALLAVLAAAPALSARAQAVDSLQLARFQLAESYLRAGQFDRAIGLLEDLYQGNPETSLFHARLIQAYESVKRYDDALALLDAHIQRLGRADASLLSERGRLRYLKGDEAGALASWDEALLQARANPVVYRIVYQSLVQVRLLERAIEVMTTARQALGDPDQFAAELAALYAQTGRYAPAMEEYLRMLVADPRRLSYVQTRLARSPDPKTALSEGLPLLERAIRQDPLNRALRELAAWAYLEDAQYDQALDAARAIDRLEQEQGAVLFDFALRATDARAYPAAQRAYEEILSRYAEAPTAPEAQMGLAELHERWAREWQRVKDAERTAKARHHFEAARDAFRTFTERYPNHTAYPEALRRLGRLQQDVFFDLAAAEATFTRVAESFPNTQAADLARYDLGRIAVLQGRLDEARLTFAQLEERLRLGELAEQARFELALLHFYRGEFESANVLAQALNLNTSTDMANDAIELKVLLNENKGPDSLSTPLRQFAEAQLLQRRRKPAEALARVDALLAAYPQHALVDDARYLRAELLRELGQPQEALALLLALPEASPQSFLADRALFAAADLQEHDLADAQAAIATYTRLIVTYPGSLLVPEARLRLRTLRGDGV